MNFKGTLAVVSLTAGFVITGINAGNAAEDKPLTRDDVRQIVKDYILDNPDVIEESFRRKQRKDMEDRMSKAKENIVKRKDEIYKNPMAPVVGSGTKEVVYFFDYNCGYCKRAFGVIKEALASNKDLKVIFRELPVLGPSSELAARYALAVNKVNKDKYFEYHTQLIEMPGEKTDEALTDLAKKVGIDEKKLKEALADKQITEYLQKERELAADLGIQGTPGFIFGSELIPGFIDKAAFDEKVKAMSSGDKDGKDKEKKN